MQLVDLALKSARHHSFTQSFNAVHLGLHQASPVVVSPALTPMLPELELLLPLRLAVCRHAATAAMRHTKASPLCTRAFFLGRMMGIAPLKPEPLHPRTSGFATVCGWQRQTKPCAYPAKPSTNHGLQGLRCTAPSWSCDSVDYVAGSYSKPTACAVSICATTPRCDTYWSLPCCFSF